jgi:hypothetical protein
MAKVYRYCSEEKSSLTLAGWTGATDRGTTGIETRAVWEGIVLSFFFVSTLLGTGILKGAEAIPPVDGFSGGAGILATGSLGFEFWKGRDMLSCGLLIT